MRDRSGLVLAMVLAALWFTPRFAAAGDAVIDADNVVIVLDASGSMAEAMPRSSASKMSLAKDALWGVVERIPAETNVGLLVFSGRNKADDWVHPLGPLDAAAFREALYRLRPNDGTPLGKFIKLGADRLLEQRQQQGGYGTYRLVIVTDGEASDRRLVDRYTPEVLTRGLTVEVIGVAMAGEHTLANQVHTYRRADDPDSLRQALAASLAEVGAGSSDDAAGEDEFALLAPWPIATAEAALVALRGSGNTPIGQAPVRITASSGGAAMATSSTATATASSGGAASSSVGSILITVAWMLVIIVLFVIALMVGTVVLVMKSAKGNR
ncbi:MAG: vWA domain-containing protein [Planctomycetota bacterium]